MHIASDKIRDFHLRLFSICLENSKPHQCMGVSMKEDAEKVWKGGLVGLDKVINLVKRRNYILIRRRKEMQRRCDIWSDKIDMKVQFLIPKELIKDQVKVADASTSSESENKSPRHSHLLVPTDPTTLPLVLYQGKFPKSVELEEVLVEYASTSSESEQGS